MLRTRRDFIRTALAGTACALAGTSLLKAGEPAVYVVQRGDTLSHIALRYGVSVGDLKRANGLNGDLIRVGQKLVVPSVAGPSGDFLGPAPIGSSGDLKSWLFDAFTPAVRTATGFCEPFPVAKNVPTYQAAIG